MRLFLLLLISILYLPQSYAQKYDAAYYQQFPGLDEVMTYFYASNEDHLKNSTHLINFEKHQDGWYAVFSTFKNFEFVMGRKDKIWEAKTQEYLLEGKLPDEFAQRAINTAYQTKVNINAFLWPLYGYEGASKDVIKLLTTVKLEDLNANDLEGLARAYEEEANYNYLGNYGHFYNKGVSMGYDSLFDVKVLDKKLMADAEKNAWKSMAIYKELVTRFPEYESIVGSIAIKYANVAMAYYLNFEMYQQFKTAKKFLDMADYPKDMLEMAKNYLRSCPPEAILVTHGDNDTYPLLYVQTKLNFRTDVTVVNRSLMAVGRYIYYLRNLIDKKQRVVTSLNMESYKVAVNYVIPFKQTNLQSVEMELFMEQINEDIAQNPNFYKEKNQPIFMLARKIDLASNLSVNLTGNYITKEELFLLDMITTNWLKRPICFTAGSRKGVFDALFSNLEQQGLVAVLSNKMIPESGFMARLHVEKTEQLFFKDFVYPKISENQKLKQEYVAIMGQILAVQRELIKHYIKQEELPIARKILTDLHKIFPIEHYNYNVGHQYFAEICLELDQRAIAVNHVLAYAKQLVKDLAQAQIPLSERPAMERIYPSLTTLQVTQMMDGLLQFATKKDLAVDELKVLLKHE